MSTERLRVFTRDLNRVAPRSPYAALEEFPIWGARLVDKCRAKLLGHAGSYHYNCPRIAGFLRRPVWRRSRCGSSFQQALTIRKSPRG